MSSDNSYKPGDVANGHVLNQDGQWMPHPIISRVETTRSTPAARAATTKRRPNRRESSEGWYSIFWLLAVVSAVGTWVAIGVATNNGGVGFGAALAALIGWLPVIAFFDIMRKEP